MSEARERLVSGLGVDVRSGPGVDAPSSLLAGAERRGGRVAQLVRRAVEEEARS